MKKVDQEYIDKLSKQHIKETRADLVAWPGYPIVPEKKKKKDKTKK